MIIAFISLKGGVGKSTLAVHAYGYAKREGMSVWLVDTDIQGSASQWLDAIDPEANCYHLTDASDAEKAVKARNADSDIVIIDGGAGLVEPTKVGLMLADVVVIPTKASRLDYTATMEVLRLANQAKVARGKKAAQVIVVPSMIQAGQLVTSQLLDELDELSVPVGPAIHQRASFAKCAGENYVWNQKDNNATAEVEMLMQSIIEK
ncbi:MAG: ParA family protein [Alphaproteobacteria bacterium]